MTNGIASAIASVLLWANPSPVNKSCADTCAMSDDGVAMLRNFEGYSPFVYKDAAGLPTIGFGHLIVSGESFTEPLVGPDAEKLLRRDLKHVEKGVNRLVVITLHQNQFDALASFSFNVGTGALGKSTLLKRVNDERHADVPTQFMRWVNAGGQPIKGLVIRREAEGRLYVQ